MRDAICSFCPVSHPVVAVNLEDVMGEDPCCVKMGHGGLLTC